MEEIATKEGRESTDNSPFPRLPTVVSVLDVTTRKDIRNEQHNLRHTFPLIKPPLLTLPSNFHLKSPKRTNRKASPDRTTSIPPVDALSTVALLEQKNAPASNEKVRGIYQTFETKNQKRNRNSLQGAKNRLYVQLTRSHINNKGTDCSKHSSSAGGGGQCSGTGIGDGPAINKKMYYELPKSSTEVTKLDAIILEPSAHALYSSSSALYSSDRLPVQETGDSGGTTTQVYQKTSKLGANLNSVSGNKGVFSSPRRKKITITLRDLTAYHPATTGAAAATTIANGGSNCVEQLNRSIKHVRQIKEGIQGYLKSVQLNPSQSKSSLATTTTIQATTTTTMEKTHPKLLRIKPMKHHRHQASHKRERPEGIVPGESRERINYCDKEKTKMILQWLSDMGGDE